MFEPQNRSIDVEFWNVDGLSLIVEQRSVLHVLYAATEGRLDGPMLWLTIRQIAMRTQDRCRDGVVPGIDYGVMSLAQETGPSFLWPEAMIQNQTEAEKDDLNSWYTRLFRRNDMGLDEKIREAVMGAGNLWVAYRPDRLVDS
jgi:hypothetical protein